jgi:subtilisin family serine protease
MTKYLFFLFINSLIYINCAFSRDLVVAVIDSGIDYLHPDINQKIKKNLREIPDDAIDNDANGFIDDFWGWNFYHNNGLVGDDNGHGTHVAGTIAGATVGIEPRAKILPIKITITPEGQVSDIYLIKAIRYAIQMKVDIINLSLRGFYANMPVTQYAIKESLKQANKEGIMVVVAAGNDGLDISNLDIFPASAKQEGVITVCAVDSKGELATFSNYSDFKVNFCAPGVGIVSAKSGHNIFDPTSERYVRMSGTSMATPYFVGLVAKMKIEKPELSNQTIINILYELSKLRTPRTIYIQDVNYYLSL